MGFDFTGIKTNLEGIKNYLNANGVKLSDEDTKSLESIFTQADTSTHKENEEEYNNGELDFEEQMTFKSLLHQNLEKIKNKISTYFNGINEKKLEKIGKTKTTEPRDAIKDERPQFIPIKNKSIKHTVTYTREDIYLIAMDQCIKRTPELKNISPASKRISIARKKYPNLVNKNLQVANNVVNMVMKHCTEYDVPELVPVITNMLGVETGGFNFSAKVLKKKGSPGGPKGSMQTDLKTIGALYNDETSSDAQYIKKLKAKYKTPNVLYNAIQTNVELGLQVGILIFKQKLRANGGSVKGAVRAYCGGSYKYDYPTKVPEQIKV